MDQYAALPSGSSIPPQSQPKKSGSLLLKIVVVMVFLSLIFFLGSLSYYLFLQRFDYLPQVTRVSSIDQSSFELPEVDTDQISLQGQLGLLEIPRNLDIQEGNLDRSSRRQNRFALTPAVDPDIYESFSGQAFADFIDLFNYEKVNPIDTRPVIRGEEEVDEVIQEIAEGRGYQLRPEAQNGVLVSVDGQQLQTEARNGWSTMKSAAAQDGLTLTLVSGYRSVNSQREIFLNSITSLSNEDIVARAVDAEINEVLITRSIPGYSRHHSGYTIDIACGNTGLTRFRETECYDWMSGNNYLNAKRFGFVPGYPEGAVDQGPDPEAWEYVWVGETSLRR